MANSCFLLIFTLKIGEGLNEHIFQRGGLKPPTRSRFSGRKFGGWQSLGKLLGDVLSIQPIHGPVFLGANMLFFFLGGGGHCFGSFWQN